MDLTTLLTNAQSPDHGVRTAAEQALKSAEASNYGMYLFELTKELANETKNPMVRRLAGLVLKMLWRVDPFKLQLRKGKSGWRLIRAYLHRFELVRFRC